jgi:hypothetical protein
MCIERRSIDIGENYDRPAIDDAAQLLIRRSTHIRSGIVLTAQPVKKLTDVMNRLADIGTPRQAEHPHAILCIVHTVDRALL